MLEALEGEKDGILIPPSNGWSFQYHMDDKERVDCQDKFVVLT